MTTYSIAPGEGPDAAYKRRLAAALMQKGMNPDQPIEHWMQGVGNMAQSIVGGLQMHKLDQQEKGERDRANEMYAKLLQNPDTASDASPVAISPDAPMDPNKVYANNEQSPLDPVVPERYANAISSIESGGNYGATGPQTKSGDRAYGKYQVMGNNVGPWTQDLYGKPMSPQEFVGNPTAQEQVFQKQFGTAMDKHGTPQDAASVWFTGKPLAQGANRQDVLGTTGQGYVDKFNAAARDPKADVAMALAAPDGQAPQPFAQSPQPRVQMAQAGPNREMLIQMLQNRHMAPMAQSIIGAQISQQFKPREYKIEITPDGRVIAADTKDPTKIKTSTVPGAGQAAIEHAASKKRAEKIAERVATNGMPATSEEAASLRKEVQQLPSYKNVTQAAPIYKTMLDSAGRDTRASDLNLVYGLGKIFDPGSVVREGEMVMVKNTASLPDWLVGAANSLNGGAALQPATRDAIMKEAHSRMMSYKQTFDQDVGMYRGIADRNKMLHDDVIPQLGDFPEFKRAAAPQAGTVPPPAPAQGGNPPMRRFNPATGKFE